MFLPQRDSSKYPTHTRQQAKLYSALF
jgi:hypothetical protein